MISKDFNIKQTNESLTEAVRYLLAKTFDLRKGEYKRAFLMQLNIFLVITTLLIVKPSVNGLFISQFGVKSLPLAFVVVALIATLFSIFYSKRLIKVPLNILIIRTHTISVITLILFGILLLTNTFVSWVIYLFYIWVAIFAVLSASQFWILANLVFNSREAKRLFGFIGAGAIAGGIFGGYLTSVLAPTLGSENLLFVSAFLLYLCIPITRSVWREDNVRKNNSTKLINSLPGNEESPLRLIQKSKHLTYMAGIVGISVIASKLVDYQFNAIASLKISNPDELTAFFGFWFSNFNLLSLFIQLFITRRVVGVFGVGSSLLILPGGIFIGAMLLLFSPVLFAAILIKMVDGSLKQSINKSAVELLALPIPITIKNRVKSFIDIFVDSIATGIGGILLILVINGFNLPTRYVSLIILVSLGVWFYFAVNMRKEYLKSFQLKIKQNSHEHENKTINIANASVLSGLIGVLQKGNVKQILWALQKTREHQNDHLFPHILKLLEHSNNEVRAEALFNLYFYRNKGLNNRISKMINDADEEVKIRAFQYLIEHDSQNRFELINIYIHNSDYRISGAALLSLAVEVRDNPELKKQYELRQVIAKRIELLATEPNIAIVKYNTKVILETIGRGHITSYFYFIEKAFSHSDHDIVAIAIKAAGFSKAEEFIDQLLTFVNDSRFENIAKSALVQYGIEILPFLELETNDRSKIDLLRKIPTIVENIDSQRSVKLLFGMLNSDDFQVRNGALLSLNKLKTNYPFLHFDKHLILRKILDEVQLLQDTLSVLYLQTKLETEQQTDSKPPSNNLLSDARKSLIALLERRLDGSLERIFRLLGLKYPSDEILDAYKGFQSNLPDIRISSIEFLENLLDTKLKRILIPIFETTALESISKAALLNLKIHIPDEIECYSMLLDGNDIKIKMAVLYLISLLKGEQYINLVVKYQNNNNPKVKDFALKALTSLKGK